ncbi:MAG: caspase family protein [Bacteroidetes bacterium]|nr:caspase family protein [Bacteroidota bacterium]
MKGENYILVIAIDKYIDSSFLSLNNAKLDAKKLIDILVSKYGYKTIKKPLFDNEANRSSIIEALNELTFSLKENDSIIIYFAGHGTIHPKTNKGYWIPYDAKYTVGDYILNSSVKDYIEGIDAKHVLLISDSCFSGTFLTQTREIGNENQFSKLEESKSRWLLASGREEKVSDGHPGVGSPFANSLIECLVGNKKKNLLFSEISNYVLLNIDKNANQQPIVAHLDGVGHEGGQMIFRLKEENNQRNKTNRSWEESFKLFCDAKETRPEWPFISKGNPETKSLGIWCQGERDKKRKDKLIPEREQRLLDAGFIFDPHAEKFYIGLGKFLAFMHKTGLNDVPAKLYKYYRSENAWHRVQQKWYQKAPCDLSNPKAYPLYRYKILVKEGIPLEVESNEDAWNQFQIDLVKFYETHERFLAIPSQVSKDPFIAELGNKLNDYMVSWKRNELSIDKIKFIEQFVDINYGLNRDKRNFQKDLNAWLEMKNIYPNKKPKRQERVKYKKVLDWEATQKNRFDGFPEWKKELLVKHNLILKNSHSQQALPL